MGDRGAVFPCNRAFFPCTLLANLFSYAFTGIIARSALRSFLYPFVLGARWGALDMSIVAAIGNQYKVKLSIADTLWRDE